MKANDFSGGKVSKTIVAQAIPMILAQLVQLLYNVVDRIYIGHLPGNNSLALTGVGLAFPVATLIAAFTFLFGTGGAPLFAMALGDKNETRAERILGNTFFLLISSSLLIFLFCFLLRRPILYLFGASDESFIYADAYLRIYLFGTCFTMLATGLNGFINAQGFPRIGMLSTVIGGGINLVLDPILIFACHMGVEGAALATLVSQAVSCIWVLHFLTGKNVRIRIRRRSMKLQTKLVGEIISLGMAGFIMQGTNCLVQVVCNATLKVYGGDLYVGIMTVLNSIRDILSLPVNGLSNGAQPVLSYNFGAKNYERVRQGIRFTAYLGIAYTFLAWMVVVVQPRMFMMLFTNDLQTIESGVRALQIYFFGFCFMAFQFIGQSSFTALGYARHAVFFSLFRKAIIVVPLTVLLPLWNGLGVKGVFLAEPISNLIGGLACFITMWLHVYRSLGKQRSEK